MQNMHPEKIPKLLYELIKNSRRSDRDLAKVLGFSQPTVTRTRRTLEDEKYVLQYTTIPDFTKIGFEIVAFTFTQRPPLETEADSLYKQLDKDPRVIFVADGNGLGGKNVVVVTMHKNYSDYSNFIADLRKKSSIQTTSSFIAILGGTAKTFSLSSLEKV